MSKISSIYFIEIFRNQLFYISHKFYSLNSRNEILLAKERKKFNLIPHQKQKS